MIGVGVNTPKGGLILGFLLCAGVVCPEMAHSVAPTEPEMSSSSISYSNGDSISIECRRAQCDFRIRVHSARHRFTIKDAETALRVIPRPVALYSLNQPPRTFSFDAESDCSTLQEYELPSSCFASFRVEEGRIVGIVETRKALGRTIEAKRVALPH